MCRPPLFFMKADRMRRGRLYTCQVGIFALTLGGLLLAACYGPDRDLVQDPFNQPLVHILETTYEPERGAVFVRWEYLGYRPVAQFRVLRSLEAGAHQIGTTHAPSLSDSHQAVASFRDTAVVSGERIRYQVAADHVDGGSVASVPAEVQIPGAQMRGAMSDPLRGSVDVLWSGPPDDVVAYEIVRRTSQGVEEVVYRTEDPLASSFRDRGLRGNIDYSYQIRSRMSSGVWLQSREGSARLYWLASSLDMPSQLPSRDRMCLAPGSPEMGASLVVAEAGADGIFASQVRYEVGWAPNGALRVYGITDFTAALTVGPVAPMSIGIAGLPAGGAAQGSARMFLGGIDPVTTRILLNAYSLPLISRVWMGPVTWIGGNADVPVVLTVDSEGRLWAGGGGALRVFEAGGAEAGRFVLPAGAKDISAIGDFVWAALPGEGRLVRADVRALAAGASGLVWEDVALPAGTRPEALSGNRHGQVFVLDASGREVLVLDTNGQQILAWQLPAGNFQNGDISVDASGGSLVHVSDASGVIHTYLP